MIINLTGKALEVASIQNILIGTVILIVALGGANLIRDKMKSGKKRFTSFRNAGYGGTKYEKKVRSTLLRKSHKNRR